MSCSTLIIEQMPFKQKTSSLSNDFYDFNKIILCLQSWFLKFACPTTDNQHL